MPRIRAVLQPTADLPVYLRVLGQVEVVEVAVLRRRRAAVQENPNDAVSPTRNGTWQQVYTLERRWRQIRKHSGLDWVTPHTFRTTVATLISGRVDAETASQ